MSSTKWAYPLHTLLTEEDLQSFITFATVNVASSDSPELTSSLEWQRRTLQSLFTALLYYGEVRPCLAYAKATGQVQKAEEKEAVLVEETGKALHLAKGANQTLKEIVSKVNAQDSKTSEETPTSLSKVEVIPYNTFIISNTLEYRNKSSPEGVAELLLQKMAKSVYASVLLALVHAKPLAQPVGPPDLNHDGACNIPPSPTPDTSAPVDIFLEDFDISSHIFPGTVTMLIRSLECLLKKATCSHQQLRELDLLAVLSFWYECNSVIEKPADPEKPAGPPKLKAKEVEKKVAVPTGFLITSEECYNTLVEFLLAQISISPALWQVSLINVLGNVCSSMVVDYDKLLALLVKFFLSASLSVDSGLVQKIVATLMPQAFQSGSKGATLSGLYMLLEILTTALQTK